MRTYIHSYKKLYIKSLLIFLFSISTFSLFSQGIPNGFTYQGIARDEEGNPVISKKIMLEISIYAGEPSETTTKAPEWQEMHEVTTNEEGFFSLVIGEGISTMVGSQKSFDVIDWKKASYYMKVRADFGVKTYGNGLVSMGVVKLQSVPYAFWSKNANIADSTRGLTLTKLLGVSESSLVKDNVVTWNGTKWTIGAGGSGFVKTDGTSDMIGDWTISKNSITLQAGTLTTKQLKLGSTTAVSTISTDAELGGTSSNHLTLSTQYAVKQYVDNRLGGSYWTANGSYLYNTDKMIGIGTATPLAKLHANVGTDMFLITGSDASNVETRMVFYGSVAALRVGKASTTQWSGANLGLNSVAFGEDNIAKGNWSAAFGYSNTSSGAYSLTAGTGNIADGQRSFALGNLNIANGVSSVAFGNQTKADGSHSFAIGNATTATADGSFAAGDGSEAGAYYSATFGSSVTYGKAKYGAAFGEKSEAYAQGSVAMGVGAYARTYGEVAVGMYNTHPSVLANAYTTWNATERVFVVGNGQSSTAMSDAMVILKNGNVGIGISSPTYTLHVGGSIYATGAITQASDIRFKKNIVGINNSLDKVLKMRGVYYDWKKTEFPERKFSDAKQIGFIAQEVELLFPELVSTDDKGYKSVDYSKLTPILVEALKEQQKQIEALKKENSTIKAELSQTKDLKDKVNTLEKQVNTLIKLIDAKNTTQKE